MVSLNSVSVFTNQGIGLTMITETSAARPNSRFSHQRTVLSRVYASGARSTGLLVTFAIMLASAEAKAQHADNGTNAASQPPPRLVVQVTVDQLRADFPTRFASRFKEGGLRYLLEQGVVFRDAVHAHANTETIVGHATLATGAHPAKHGMVGNLWFDRETGYLTYNVEDSRYRLLTIGSDVDDDVEIDPTQRAARSEGRSPAAMLVPAFADQLLGASAGAARAIAVSVKDRGAISMAGHGGTAFWFSKANAAVCGDELGSDPRTVQLSFRSSGRPALGDRCCRVRSHVSTRLRRRKQSLFHDLAHAEPGRGRARG